MSEPVLGAANLRFELTFDAEARNDKGYRTEITVIRRGRGGDEHFDLPTDEGKVIGGEGTAPWPLCYFASGLAGCLSTHLRSFSKQLAIPLEDFGLAVRCHWEAQQSGNQPYRASPVAFTVDIELNSTADDADKIRLVEAASEGCFVEQSLKPGLVKHRLKSGESWIEI